MEASARSRSQKQKNTRSQNEKRIFTATRLCVIAYYVAVFAGKECDSAIGVTALGTIVGGVLSYLLYQLGLKNSRNRYGIDADGQPYKTKIEEEEDD